MREMNIECGARVRRYVLSANSRGCCGRCVSALLHLSRLRRKPRLTRRMG